MTNEGIKRRMRSEFKRDLAVKGCELRKALSEQNVLDNSSTKNILDLFKKDLEVLVSNYAIRIGVDLGNLPASKINGSEYLNHLTTLGGGLAGWFGGGALAALTVTTKTTGWWLWKKVVDVSLASFIAHALGLSVAVVTGGLSIVTAGIGALAVAAIFKNPNKNGKISRIMQNYEEKVVPDLMKWLDNAMEKA